MSRIMAFGSLALLAAVSASSGVTRLSQPLQKRLVPGTSHLVAVGTRSLAQRHGPDAKLDSMLADLVRHAPAASAAPTLADLHSLSPAARFGRSSATGLPLIAIDAITRGDARALEAALVGLGLEHPSVYSNDVGGWLPVSQLEAAAALGEVAGMRAAMSRTLAAGPVATQGDFVQGSSALRTTYPTLDGTGITVGILSDSFDCYSAYGASGSGVPVSGGEGYAPNGFTADYATDVSTGALPAAIDVLAEASCLDYGGPLQPPFGDEGRAMAQIVYAVAPGAKLAFNTADPTEADFANGILALKSAGAKVIADDITYFDEPYYQDGIVAEAINTVEAAGVAYFTAAGNNSDLSYENAVPAFAMTLTTSGPNANEYLLNFDTSGATTTTSLPVNIPAMQPGDLVGVVLEWDQPYLTGAPGSGGATSQLDLCVSGQSGSIVIEDYDGNPVSCTGLNTLGQDPYQILILANPANAKGNTPAQSLEFTLGLAMGSKAPGRLILTVFDDGLGSSITQFATNSGTIQGHHTAATAATVGAAFYFSTPACGTSPAQLEAFSSIGGTPILFDSTGTRLATPVVRQKPDFTGPDGVNDTFLGFTLASDGVSGGMLNTNITECQNNPDYPNFFGTSAATPHAAGIAALILQANPATTPTALYTALRTSALAMSTPAPNYVSGYGFIQAGAALALIAPGAPTLTLGTNPLTVGGSTALSWTGINAKSCTASGAWSGTLAASGTKTLTPTAAGSAAYSLTCTNAVGTSAKSTATLEAIEPVATQPPPSSGGGGAIDGVALAGLAALLRGSYRRRHARGA